MTSPIASLEAGEVHIEMTFSGPLADPGLLVSYLEVLSPEERERQRRFVFSKDRHEFLVAHALLRTTLSRYASVPPESWRFKLGEHGKPEIAAPLVVPAVRFNLAHTAGLAVCAVALGVDIGVDAENADRRSDLLAIAEHRFAPAERARLAALPPDEQRAAFFRYWTLKEAYVKARGGGLTISLDGFWFDFDRDPPAITFTPRADDDAADWQFFQLRPGPQHFAAAAIHRPGRADRRVVVREVVPLRRLDHQSRDTLS